MIPSSHRMMRHALVVLLALALVLGLGVVGAGAQSIDPQSLAGEWRGQAVRSERGQSGPYNLTIVKVEGDRVSLRIERSGRTSKAIGTLKGNTLTYGGGQGETELTISDNGKEMRGTWTGSGGRANISLTKQ
jgi:hypothetical protein